MAVIASVSSEVADQTAVALLSSTRSLICASVVLAQLVATASIIALVHSMRTFIRNLTRVVPPFQSRDPLISPMWGAYAGCRIRALGH